MNPILYNNWEKLGKKWETGDDLPAQNVLFITCDHIAAFFRLITENEIKTPYKIISAASDYGPCYQQEFPPHKDFQKWFPMIGDLSGLGYRDLMVHARLDSNKCLAADKFSLRSYSWTHSTFNKVPNNVTWFCTNLNISEPNCYPIPFGLDQECFDLIQKYKDLPKKDRIFACFENNTNERLMMKRHYRQDKKFLVLEKLPKEEYIKELCQSEMVLCPTGNGLDSYRILESLYAGSIPIIEYGRWSQFYADFGVLYFDTNQVTSQNKDILDFDLWKNLILK